jgi:hypothetical protein
MCLCLHACEQQYYHVLRICGHHVGLYLLGFSQRNTIILNWKVSQLDSSRNLGIRTASVPMAYFVFCNRNSHPRGERDNMCLLPR